MIHVLVPRRFFMALIVIALMPAVFKRSCRTCNMRATYHEGPHIDPSVLD